MDFYHGLVLIAVVAGTFSSLSRGATQAFSLSDLEALLRKKQQTRDLLPQVEHLAERLDSYAFSLTMFDLWAKAVGVIGIYGVASDLVGDRSGPLLALFWIVGFIVFICLVDIPFHGLGVAWSDRLVLTFRRLWPLIHWATYPANLPFHLLHGLRHRLTQKHQDETGEERAEEDIMAAVALGELHGQLTKDEAEMIESILSLSNLEAEDVMTPRTEMDAADIEGGIAAALEAAREKGRSRLPVYEGDRDHVVGILYVKDAIGVDSEELGDLRRLLRKPFLVPATKRVVNLLQELRRNRVHLAVVIDEFGGTAGIVTIEDIIEEVFGDIDDEYDQVQEDEVLETEEGSVDLDARMRIDEVNEQLDLNLPESEQYESLGGLIITQLGYIPKEGVSVYCNGVNLTVKRATARRVVRVHLERVEET